MASHFFSHTSQRLLWLLIILLGSACIFLLFLQAKQWRTTLSDTEIYQQTIREKYQIFAPPIPDSIVFFGENIPLDNYLVREALDQELIQNMYRQSATFLILKRATRYFPVIEPILAEHDVPMDLKYLCVAESALSQAVSAAGAEGFWQFMPKTAREYGLVVTEDVDERYHIEKATHAACEYLKKQYNRQGKNWLLACAAYNLGENGLQRRMESQQKNSYFEVHLPTETARYIYRILALKIIMECPEDYGFYMRSTDHYPPIISQEIEIDSTIADIYSFAQQQNISYKVLRAYNPWLRSTKLPNPKREKYTLKMPVEQGLSWSFLMQKREENSMTKHKKSYE